MEYQANIPSVPMTGTGGKQTVVCSRMCRGDIWNHLPIEDRFDQGNFFELESDAERVEPGVNEDGI